MTAATTTIIAIAVIDTVAVKVTVAMMATGLTINPLAGTTAIVDTTVDEKIFAVEAAIITTAITMTIGVTIRDKMVEAADPTLAQ
jgi:hypothetical protein